MSDAVSISQASLFARDRHAATQNCDAETFFKAVHRRRRAQL